MDDPIAVIEAAYRHDLDERPWLEAVGGAIARLLHTDSPITVSVFDTNGGLKVRAVPVLGKPELTDVFIGATREVGPERIGAAMRMGTCCSLREALWSHPAIERATSPLGISDAVGLVAGDPTGRGVLIAVTLSQLWDPSPCERTQLAQLAAHIAAGHRVRRLLGRDQNSVLPDIFGSAEAVLTPSGQVVHAESEAKLDRTRQDLRAAALAIDRVRSDLRREDPNEAVETWRALVSGRWSLVDHFDTDGRRYLIARRNDPRVDHPPQLTPRERQVVIYRALGHPLKLIAYELGLSISTVAGNLSRGMKKLGIASQSDLVSLLAGAMAPDEGERD